MDTRTRKATAAAAATMTTQPARRTSTDTSQKPQDLMLQMMEELRNIREDIRKTETDIRQDLKETRKEMRTDMKHEIDKLGKKLETLTKDVSKIKVETKEIKEQVIQVQTEMAEVKGKQQEEDIQITQQELRYRERCLRFRGVPETSTENLYEKMLPALAEFLDIEEDRMEMCIDRMFRVSSRTARERKLPRDIIITFTRTATRDKILQRSYEGTFKIEEKDVRIFKDIPFQILKKRQDYKPLANLLMKLQINYRWEKTEGISFSYKQQRYRINTVHKAKEMMERLKKDLQKTSAEGREEEQQLQEEGNEERIQIQAEESEGAVGQTQDPEQEIEEEGELPGEGIQD